jgi:hypothetical protein
MVRMVFGLGFLDEKAQKGRAEVPAHGRGWACSKITLNLNHRYPKCLLVFLGGWWWLVVVGSGRLNGFMFGSVCLCVLVFFLFFSVSKKTYLICGAERKRSTAGLCVSKALIFTCWLLGGLVVEG